VVQWLGLEGIAESDFTAMHAILVNGRALRRVFSWFKEDAFRRILTNSGWLLGANGISTILGLAQGILVARTLGVEQYGALGVVITFVTVVNRLTSFRMSEFVIKYVTDALAVCRKDQAAAAIKLAMVVEASASVLAFGIVLLLAPLGAHWFLHIAGAEALIIAYAVVILGNLVSETAIGVLQVFNQFRIQSLLTSIGRVASLIAVTVVFVLQGGLWGILLAYLVSNLMSASLLLITAVREIGRRLGVDWWHVSFTALNGRWRSAGKFALSTNVSATLSLITKDSDLLWLGYFRNPAEVGYYKLAMSLATLALMPVSPLVQTIYPEISRMAASKQWPKFRSLLRKGSLVVALYIIPLGLVLSVSSKWLIRVFYGSEFVPAAIALVILMIGLSFTNLLFWSRPALLALGCPDYPMRVNILIAVLKVIGVFTLLPTFGYTGNAALLTGLYLLGVTISVWKVRSEICRQESMTA
jgi:O-antigen/teichoic acid export membrane protein